MDNLATETTTNAVAESQPVAEADQSQVVGQGAAAISDKLVNIPHPAVKMEVVPFHFKKDSLGNKRPTINLTLPYITLDGLIDALNDETQQAFILDVLNAEVYKAARMQVGDESKPVNKQEELDLSKLTLEALANMPKAERTGGGISKEIWEAFAKDYVEIMPGITGKPLDNVVNASKLLLAKFQPVKTNKPVIAFLREQLATWFSKSPNAEDFQECYEFLDNKADTLLKADEAALLQNL